MDAKERSMMDFGGSLPVENVQALASKNLKDIPLRYIRPEIEFDQVSIDDESLQIPVIDMDKLAKDPSGCDDNELDALHLACLYWGFFQLINHGVPEEVIEKMKSDMQEFFKLPFQEKMACKQPPNSVEGYGQAFVVSEDQKLDWGDMLFLLAQPLSHRKNQLWPTFPTSFRSTLDKYSLELQRVTEVLLRSMATNLGLDSERLVKMFESGSQGMRMNYYPPCIQANKVIGLTPHSDATGLTVLVQVNEVQGLQIRKNGKWLPIKPIPGAFIINVGDVIEVMSNGQYKSIEHRAVINYEKERLSIATFHSPNINTVIGPLPELVEKNKANYKTISHEEFIKLGVSNKLDGKSRLNYMKQEP